MRTFLSTIFLLILFNSFAQFNTPIDITRQYQGNQLISDWDYDGDLDLIGIDENIFLLKNNGNAVFEKVALTDSWSYQGSDIMKTADLNSDGFSDLIVSNSLSHKLVCFLNDGSGGLGSEVQIDMNYSANLQFNIIDIQDVDENGYLDIVGKDNGVSTGLFIYKNQGNLNFSFEYMPLNLPVKLADFDNDGHLDAFRGGWANYYVVFGDGNGGYSDSTLIPVALNIVSPFTVDLDLDGDLDLLFRSSNTTYTIMNLGNHTFTGVNSYASVSGTVFSFYDFTGDGYPDILTENTGTPPVLSLSANDGVGGFSAPTGLSVNLGTAYVPLQTGDFNNDGFEDIITSHCLLLKGNGPASFDSGTVILESGTNSFSTLGDVNGDSIQELIYFSSSGLQYKKFVGNVWSDSSYLITAENLAGKNLEIVDLNGDGLNEIAYTNTVSIVTTFKLLVNSPLGGFSADSLDQPVIGGYRSSKFSDLDADDLPDLIYVQNLSLTTRKNLGGLSFDSPNVIYADTFGGTDAYVTAIDIDVDSDQDVIVYFRRYNGYQIFLFTNLGDGTFEPAISLASSSTGAASAIGLADLNSDGLNDFYFIHSETTGSNPQNILKYYENEGGLNFQLHQSLVIDRVSKITITDIDTNGDPDIVLVDGEKISVSYQTNGYFLPQYYVPEFIDIPVRNIGFVNSSQELIFSGNFQGVYSAENTYSNDAFGSLYVDNNDNSTRDADEAGIPFKPISLLPSNQLFFSNVAGYYGAFNLSNGVNTLIPPAVQNFQLSGDSLQYTFETLPAVDSLYGQDFSYVPSGHTNDLNVQLVNGFPRCNQQVPYWITIENVGSTTPSGIIYLQLDTALGFISADPIPDSVIGNNIYWSYDTLQFFQFEQIKLEVLQPPSQNSGNLMLNILTVSAIDSSDTLSQLFVDTLQHTSVCAYDPNDKVAEPAGIGAQGYISPNTDWVEYTVRFQNTGNDTATTVVIHDQLDTDFEYTTLEILASSFPAITTCDVNGFASFAFVGIDLPDSTANEMESHGFIRYRVHLKNNLEPGTQIKNTAEIFFDFNDPVRTNTTLQTIFDCQPIDPNISSSQLCFGDTLYAELSPILYDTCNWNISGLWQTTSSFNWISDSSGVIPLQLNINSQLCGEFDTTFLITVFPESVPQIGDTIRICYGESAVIYGVEQENEGNYFTTLTNVNGCDSIIGIRLEVMPIPVVSLSPFDIDTICVSGGNVNLPEGLPPGGMYSGQGINGSSFDPTLTETGMQTIFYSYSNTYSCESSDSTNIFVENCLNIESLSLLNFVVFPNPSNDGRFTIHFSSELNNYAIRIISMPGEIIWSKQTCFGTDQMVDLSRAQAGTYLIEIINSDGLRSTGLININ